MRPKRIDLLLINSCLLATGEGCIMGYEFIESDDYDDGICVTNINLDSDYLYQ